MIKVLFVTSISLLTFLREIQVTNEIRWKINLITFLKIENFVIF